MKDNQRQSKNNRPRTKATYRIRNSTIFKRVPGISTSMEDESGKVICNYESTSKTLQNSYRTSTKNITNTKEHKSTERSQEHITQSQRPPNNI